jgi:hypothetical protein
MVFEENVWVGYAVLKTSVLCFWNHRKKVSPRHQSRYIGSTLDVVYRKLKVVDASITFAVGS